MKVGLFIPCYIDMIVPQAGISTYKLLRRFPDIEVEFINQASCCALPEKDMGYVKGACEIERNLVAYLSGYDHIVVPSGICSDQISRLLTNVVQTEEVKHIREVTHDVVEFLHDVLKVKELPWASFPHRVALHNGCHSLRYLLQARPSELMVPHFSKTEALLSLVKGCEVGYASRQSECCGFGGTFAIWDQACSGQQGLDKVNDYVRNCFEYVTSADMSCLLHQSCVARKFGLDNLKFFYIAEILNGDAQESVLKSANA